MNVNYNHTALSSGVKCSGSLHINELEVFKQFGSILAGACPGSGIILNGQFGQVFARTVLASFAGTVLASFC